MATMSQTWSVFTAVLLLAVQLCVGDKSCTIWSSAGPVVQLETSFKIYCTFKCKCKGSMYSEHPPKPQKHRELNSTTIYFNVVNITKNRTYSCECNCSPALDPCGLDISAGYLPDRPKNLSCIYNVINDDGGFVSCTWNRGRDTYLRNSSALWVRTVSGNRISGLANVTSKGNVQQSVTFPVSRSVQLISLWVQAQNPLGSATSSTINYTLSDIAMPSAPFLVQPKCLSRECSITVNQSVRTQHLEIQYKEREQITWITYTHQGALMNTSISSLEPYRLYHFRARSKFITGLWSEWSASISSLTQEEAPAKELDVWFAQPASDSKSLRVYWKEANISISRGKILQYKLRVYNPNSDSDFVTNITRETRNYLVSFCANCEVTVWACNSKGLSPPARITTHHIAASAAKPPQDVRVNSKTDNVTISWRKPGTAPQPVEYVVEWYPESRKLEELRWVRLPGNEDHAVITGLKTHECYEGAVFVFYDNSSVSRTRFSDVATLESAPVAGPVIQQQVEGNKVIVTWTELPRSQTRGCVITYKIYLSRGSGHQKDYSVPASKTTFIIEDLSPALYSMWMTASTAKGEGPAGQKVKLFIQESQLPLLLVFGVITMMLLCLVCLWQSSAVKQRFWMFFQCLMPDVVPDPANSKWAKECIQEKGKMNLQVQLSNSSVTNEEDEPILVDVEELPKHSDGSPPTGGSSLCRPQSSLSPEMLLYPLTTYIKSLSHDSDCSDHTQASLDTNTTVDYISSHGPGNTAEEDEEEEEMLGFFPSHSVFTEPLDFGGKLTLDVVKIDCSDFFQNI